MLLSRQARVVHPPSIGPHAPRRLTESDAIDIWIARWLRIRRKDLLTRYGCDPRRLYEVWEGTRFPDSRDKALELFRQRYPTLVDRVDYGPHRRTPRRVPADLQPSLFEGMNPPSPPATGHKIGPVDN
jgi:hypothetical protein